jgi:hypothetical protein
LLVEQGILLVLEAVVVAFLGRSIWGWLVVVEVEEHPGTMLEQPMSQIYPEQAVLVGLLVGMDLTGQMVLYE